MCDYNKNSKYCVTVKETSGPYYAYEGAILFQKVIDNSKQNFLIYTNKTKTMVSISF